MGGVVNPIRCWFSNSRERDRACVCVEGWTLGTLRKRGSLARLNSPIWLKFHDCTFMGVFTSCQNSLPLPPSGHACYALSSYLVILFGRKLNGRTLFFSRMQIRLSAFRLVCPSLHDQERFLFGVSCLQNPQSSSFKFLVRKWGEAFQIPPYFSLKMSHLWNFSVQLLWVLFFLFVSLVTSSLHVPLSPCLLLSFTSLRQFDGLSHVAIWLARCTSFGVKVWNSDMIASE
jgi:hypothetical protein